MKKSILTTLSVLATAFLIISPITHAETSAQQRDQAVTNDNNILNNLSDPSNNDLNSSGENDDDDQNSNDADNGDSSSNSDDGND